MGKDVLAMLGKVSKPEKEKENRNINAGDITKVLGSFNNRWHVLTQLIMNVPSTIKTTLTKSEPEPIKVAAFDMDSTLISTKSGATFARSSDDWKWWSKEVKSTVQDYSRQGYVVVIFTNQGSVVPIKTAKSFQNFSQRVNQIVSELSIEVLVFASTRKPTKKDEKTLDAKVIELQKRMRKPDIGMWEELIIYLQGKDLEVDIQGSFFVGDAAGRSGDFLDSDRKFSEGIGLNFKVPEDVFEVKESTE